MNRMRKPIIRIFSSFMMTVALIMLLCNAPVVNASFFLDLYSVSNIYTIGDLQDVRDPDYKKRMVKGSTGTIIMFADLSGNCNNSTSMLKVLLQVLDKTVQSDDIELYVIQIRNCDDQTLIDSLAANKIPSDVLVHNEGEEVTKSYSRFYNLYSSCYSAAKEQGEVSSLGYYDLPMIVFADGAGTINRVSTGGSDAMEIVSCMKDCGFNVNLGYDFSVRVNGTISYEKAYECLDLLNEMRKDQGLKELIMDKDLTEAAMQRAAESSVLFNTSHIRPDGSSCFTVSSKCKGENIIYGCSTADDAITNWSNSPSHYTNMMMPDYKNVGIGVFYTGETYYWVICFGRSTANELNRGMYENWESSKEFEINAVSSYVKPYVKAKAIKMNVGEERTVQVYVSPINNIETEIHVYISLICTNGDVLEASGSKIKCIGDGTSNVTCMIVGNEIDRFSVFTGIDKESISNLCHAYGYDSGTKNNPVYWTYDYNAVPHDQSSLDYAATHGYTASHVPYSSEKYKSGVKNEKDGKLFMGEYIFNRSLQCYGFADFIGNKLTGKIPSTQWRKFKSLDVLNENGGLQVGDVIRSVSGHSAMVLNVNDDGTFTVVQCLGSTNSRNKITYNDYFNSNSNYKTISNIDFEYVCRYEGALNPVHYKVNCMSMGHGSVSPSVADSAPGKTVGIVAIPDAGYEIGEIVVNDSNGNPVAFVDGQFVMPASEVVVLVSFRRVEYSLAIEYDPQVVSVNGIKKCSNAKAGDLYNFCVNVEDGFEILSVTANGYIIDETNGVYETIQPASDLVIIIEVKEITKPVTYKWVSTSGNWSYIDSNGNKTRGFATIDGDVYYFDKTGIMQTGWVYINGKYYYFGKSGVMETSWLKVGGKWYYFFEDGSMAVGIANIGGVLFCFKESGALATGWYKNSDGTYYYFTTNGAVTGWKQISKTWYYFDPSTALMATGTRKIDGKIYVFSSSGAMLKSGWKQSGGDWYYLAKSGDAYVNKWLKDGKKWYYFGGDGKMLKNTSKTIGGKVYNFNSSGACLNP